MFVYNKMHNSFGPGPSSGEKSEWRKKQSLYTQYMDVEENGNDKIKFPGWKPEAAHKTLFTWQRARPETVVHLITYEHYGNSST